MYQKMTAIGYLTKDPIVRTVSGKKVANFTIAINPPNDKGKPRPMWLNCACWGKVGELAEKYLSKGRLVLVEGYLNYADDGNPKIFRKKDNSPGSEFSLTVVILKFLPSGSGKPRADATPPPPNPPQTDWNW